ncbi:MAG: tetraacyldisaccharide 4'-kinase [Bacteroidota bacterium]|nr:tetraacyldisaccharide 4'-kinase [Bacteroidota bacterium]
MLPFALVYWVVIWLRNVFYNKDILKSSSFGMPVICVGNLSVGGTGKSPMVEYLVANLKEKFKVATLSRGYKRKTKGYALANETSTALEIGDEPMLFHLKFPDVPVSVGEERLVAIPQVLHDKPGTQVIILDDAFQHRAIRAGLNILLTDCNNLFTRDFFLPTGDLRDLKSSYKRADIIVVTKCEFDFSDEEKNDIIEEMHLLPHQHVFFTAIEYGLPYHLLQRQNHKMINERTEVLLVTGIANPKPLKNYLDEQSDTYQMMHYPDHHIFTIDDWKDIKKKFNSIQSSDKMILTTEKDAMRLVKFETEVNDIPLYVLPIEHRFLFNETYRFNELVVKYIENALLKSPLDGEVLGIQNETLAQSGTER